MFFLFYNSNLLWSFSLLGDCLPSFHFIYNPFLLFKMYLLAKGTLFFRTIFYISRGNCSVWLFGDNFLSSDSIIVSSSSQSLTETFESNNNIIFAVTCTSSGIWLTLQWVQCIRTVKFVVPCLGGAVTE